MTEKNGSVLLIVAWALLGFFNAIAIALFVWSSASMNSRSDEFAAVSFICVLVAWLGDLPGLVLASIGLWRARNRAAASVSGIFAVVLALASGVIMPFAVFARFLAAAPVPIH